MDLRKFAVSDQHEGSLGATEKSHSFIVDIENMSFPAIKENPSSNSTISVKLQGNLSRKGSRREDKNKSILSASSGVTDRSSSSGVTLRGDDCNPSKSPLAPVESLMMKESFNKQPQQAITIMAENRCQSKKYTKQRSFGIGPKQQYSSSTVTKISYIPSKNKQITVTTGSDTNNQIYNNVRELLIPIMGGYEEMPVMHVHQAHCKEAPIL